MFKNLLTLLLLVCMVCETNAKDKLWNTTDSVPMMKIPENSLILYDNWHMKESYYAGMDGSEISTSDYKHKNWYDTTIPATVLGVLVNHGIYPDPYIGLNNMKIPDASDEVNVKYNLKKYSHLPKKENPWKSPYWFRKEFVIPKEFKGKDITLNFNGLNYKADIWFNGKLIDNHKNVIGMFRRFQFNITDKINPEGINTLAVCVYPLDYPGNQFRAPLDGPFGSLGGPGGDGEILRNVTQYCTIGWDWVPSVRDRNMGIWQHVYITASGPVRIYDPAVFTDINLPDTTKARITIRHFAENFSDNEKKIEFEYKISPLNFKGDSICFKKEYTLSPNTKKEITINPDDSPLLVMNNPQLWWPKNYGNQNLYKLEITATADGKTSNKASTGFGVREVSTCVLPSGGRAFKVNNRIIRFNGGAWIPDFMLTWSAQRYHDEVRMMADGNHTIVRINGCGIIVPDVFMEACDKYGLLVWQELSRTSVEASSKKESSRTWTPPYVDTKIYLDNIKDCIIRMRSHPSLIIWCGSNEAAPQSDLGMALQNEILPSLDGTRIWLPGSAETPWWSNIETRGWTGGPWDLKPIKQYYSLYADEETFTFKNEIGLASPPNINSVAASIPEFNKPKDEWFPFNKALSYHDAAGFTFKALNDLMIKNLGKPSSLNEYLWMGNLFNNMAYRTIFEAANKARPLNAGTMLWKTNAAWPSFNWQVFDWFMRANAGYYSMKSACKPVHIQASHDDMTIQISNLTKDDLLNMNINVRVFSVSGKLEQEIDRSVSAKSDAITLAGSLPEILHDGNLHFVSLKLLSDKNVIIDQTDIWMQKECDWKEMMKMKNANLSIEKISETSCDSESTYIFKVKNTSDIPAVNVSLSLLSSIQGDEILPAFWNDNEFILMPQDEKEFRVSVSKKNIGEGNIHLNVEGLNIIPFSVGMETEKLVNFAAVVKDITYMDDKNGRLKIKVEQCNAHGARIINIPVPVYIDNKLYRNILVGVSDEHESECILELDNLTPGEHIVKVGKLEKCINL